MPVDTILIFSYLVDLVDPEESVVRMLVLPDIWLMVRNLPQGMPD